MEELDGYREFAEPAGAGRSAELLEGPSRPDE